MKKLSRIGRSVVYVNQFLLDWICDARETGDR